MRIEQISNLPYEEMSQALRVVGPRSVWEDSTQKVAVYHEDHLLLYAGAIPTNHGTYIWTTITPYFMEHFQIGVRAAFRTLNKYALEYDRLWCLIERDDAVARRLAKIAGFWATGRLVKAPGLGTCCEYRR
jgi:hypothetical protein